MSSNLLAIGVGELCQRLKVPYRHVRYVLERGFLPDGVDPSPERGNHRVLHAEQAFWLGVLLKLKQAGMKTPMAAKVADFTMRGLRAVAQNLNLDRHFAPHLGKLQTEYQWYVDIGDLRYVRIATTAEPSRRLHEYNWILLRTKEDARDATPIVILRLDVGRLAAMLNEEPRITS